MKENGAYAVEGLFNVFFRDTLSLGALEDDGESLVGLWVWGAAGSHCNEDVLKA